MIKRPPCWNNRPPMQTRYLVEVRNYSPGGYWTHGKEWVEHELTTECQQPGPGYPPDAGCVGCEHLKI